MLIKRTHQILRNNTKMQPFHKVEHWNQRVDNMDEEIPVRFLSLYAREMIERSGVSTGHVLDVATGTGLIPFFLENKYPELHKITGVDYSPNMIQRANEKKGASSKIEFHVMDGQDLKFADDTFDHVFANMGIMFYSDIVKGMKELQRVLKPGGTGGFTTWPQQYPGRDSLEAVASLGLMERMDGPVLSLSETEELEKKLKEAGIESYEIIQLDQSIKVPEDQFLDSKKHVLLKFKDRYEEIVEKIRELTPPDEQNNYEIKTKANVVLFNKK